MSVLNKLASAVGRGDEAPNIALANEIAAQQDHAAVRELVEHLDDNDKAISSDCIKVLYEVGGLQPDLTPIMLKPSSGCSKAAIIGWSGVR